MGVAAFYKHFSPGEHRDRLALGFFLHLAESTPPHPAGKEHLGREIESTDRVIDRLAYELYGLQGAEELNQEIFKVLPVDRLEGGVWIAQVSGETAEFS